MQRTECNRLGLVWALCGLLGLAVSALAATFPLPIPTRPTSFPLSRPSQAGTVAVWGRNLEGQTNVPAGAATGVAIAAGNYDTAVLREDGTVVAWGGANQTQMPPGLGGVVAIAAGSLHTVALTADGSVAAWGYNYDGEANVPAGLAGVVGIAAGGAHSVALRQDGSVVAWGQNFSGQTNVPADLGGVVAIAAGGDTTAALKQDGTLVAWGLQTNLPFGLSGLVGLGVGGAHMVALRRDGTVVAWGNNRFGQSTVPVGLSGVVAVAAGAWNTLALTQNGTVVAWGDNTYGQTNMPPAVSGALAVGSGLGYTAALVAYRVIFLIGGAQVFGSGFTNRGPALISLQSPYANGLTFYKLDGLPAGLGLLYHGPFTVNRSSLISATTFSSDLTQSNETSFNLAIQPNLTLTSGGGGSVAVSPASGPWPTDFMASVTATPSNGWTFLGWLGDASGSNATMAVSMNRDKSLKANFGTTPTFSPIGAGGFVADPSTAPLPYGASLRLTAVPQAGSYFSAWGGTASGNSNPISLLITGATPNVSAVFGSLPVGKRALTVAPHGRGRVNVSPTASYYTSGTVVKLTAVPDTGQAFLGWLGDASGISASLSFSVTTNLTVVANFTARPQLKISSLDGMTPDGFRASLAGVLGTPYDVLASSNLQTWDVIGTLTNSLGTAQFNDPLATNTPARFYRAVER